MHLFIAAMVVGNLIPFMEYDRYKAITLENRERSEKNLLQPLLNEIAKKEQTKNLSIDEVEKLRAVVSQLDARDDKFTDSQMESIGNKFERARDWLKFASNFGILVFVVSVMSWYLRHQKYQDLILLEEYEQKKLENEGARISPPGSIENNRPSLVSPPQQAP